MSLARNLTERLAARDRSAIARAISSLENESVDAPEVRAALAGRPPAAHVLGVTGPPGAGKSTLIGALIGEALARGRSVGVIAVDPSSPLSGGALLGDRLRMDVPAGEERVFIRSLAARGHLGGVTRATREIVRVLDAAGFALVIVETVGVGQSEVEVAEIAHTRLVVCPPEAGDDVQAIKAGVYELADLFALNKADRPGAPRAEQALLGMLAMRAPAGWAPQVLRTVATRGEGVAALLEAIDTHRAWLGARWQEIA